jgi:ABC-type branched-subunit amino acid transport system ATPase component
LGASARALLEVREVHAAYGKVDILHGVTLEVGVGEVVAIVGPNGAGKSTVLKTVMGFLRPRPGSVRLAGEEIGGLPTHAIVRRGVAYVPQGRIVFPRMTVLENLEMGGYTLDRPRLAAGLERVFGLFPRLRERPGQAAGTMSGGEQQMLAMGRALMLEPRIVLMDEPSLGLAPRFVELVFERIDAMRRAGLTIALVEQNAARALEVSDRGYVLELGRNRLAGASRELLGDRRVREMYLGG